MRPRPVAGAHSGEAFEHVVYQRSGVIEVISLLEPLPNPVPPYSLQCKSGSDEPGRYFIGLLPGLNMLRSRQIRPGSGFNGRFSGCGA